MRRSLTRNLAAATATLATTVAGLAATVALSAPAHANNPVTPGNFTGFGFDQCVAPTQQAMNKWLKKSPYLAVGIYTSGDSRGCRVQPNLTPTWVAKQLKKGWRLLPITLGPQASCHPSFPRYGNDPVISAAPANGYAAARVQGSAEADKAVAAAQALGIVPGSTLWYDLEGTGPLYTNTGCRESSLSFLSAWTERLHEIGYVSGVYSSAGSGIKMLDDARVERPGAYTLPDQLWIARWDGVANTSTSYIREDGWRPGGRMKQYLGGHLETWGKVTINIDSNYLDLGAGSPAQPEPTACGGTKIDFPKYRAIKAAKARPAQTKALQCLLKQQGSYDGKISGKVNKKTKAAIRSFTGRSGSAWNKKHWMQLHAASQTRVLKTGSNGAPVRRLQRALNAAGGPKLAISGTFDEPTKQALRAYQRKVGIGAKAGVAAPSTWKSLRAGKRK